jgi:hypothetical protein
LAQGYFWVKKNLYSPVKYLKQYYPNNLSTKDIRTLFESYSILADINTILESYGTAYHWRSLAYAIDSNVIGIVEDMIYLSQISGITKNMDSYIKQYRVLNPDRKVNDLYRGIHADNKNILKQRHKLNMFCPQKVIETILDESCKDLKFIKTLAYGAALNIDIFIERLQKHIETGEELKLEHLYYFPSVILNSSAFWNLIIKYETQIATASCDFDIIVSNKKILTKDNLKYLREYQEMPPFLHLARTEHDIEKINTMIHKYPSWRDPHLCKSFFMEHGRMPTWDEFYSLYVNLEDLKWLEDYRTKYGTIFSREL